MEIVRICFRGSGCTEEPATSNSGFHTTVLAFPPKLEAPEVKANHLCLSDCL
jgi:hypothetical protein